MEDEIELDIKREIDSNENKTTLTTETELDTNDSIDNIKDETKSKDNSIIKNQKNNDLDIKDTTQNINKSVTPDEEDEKFIAKSNNKKNEKKTIIEIVKWLFSKGIKTKDKNTNNENDWYYNKENKVDNVQYLESLKIKFYSVIWILILSIISVLLFNLFYFANDNYALYKKYLKQKLVNKNKNIYINKLDDNYKGIKEILDSNDLVMIKPSYFKENIIQHLYNMIKIIKEDKTNDNNLLTKIVYKNKNISVNIINVKYYSTIKKILLKIRQLQRYYIINDLGIAINKRNQTYSLSLKLAPVSSLYIK